MRRFFAKASARLWVAMQIQHPNAVVAVRGTLLNIIALTWVCISIVGLVYMGFVAFAEDAGNTLRDVVLEVVLIGILSVVFVLNRHGYTRVAAWMFLLTLLTLVTFSDEPRYLIEGRSTIVFCIPIAMGSAVAIPSASFILAALSSLALYGLAWVTGLIWEPTALSIPLTTIVFFMIALVSWLTTSRLERVLTTLQMMNRVLEERVAIRTRELTVANQQLQRMNERLVSHDRLRSAFISMVSHDLRAPLVGILSNTEILGLNVCGALTDNQSGAVKRIAHNARSLLRLVNDLLDQTQIEAGQILSLHPTRFSPEDLLTETVAAIGDLARAKGLNLTTQISGDMPTVLYGDPQRLLQILINLTANAIKFTDVGSVNLSAARPDAGHWSLQVRDSGRGIPPSEQVYIFEPFRRGELAGASTGAGLGLSIVKHLVGLMHGEIQLTSEEGCGSVFTILLPYDPAPLPLNDTGG